MLLWFTGSFNWVLSFPGKQGSPPPYRSAASPVYPRVREDPRRAVRRETGESRVCVDRRVNHHADKAQTAVRAEREQVLRRVACNYHGLLPQLGPRELDTLTQPFT